MDKLTRTYQALSKAFESLIRARDMIENRNLTSHCYDEELADGLVRLMPAYYGLIEQLLRRLKPESFYE